MIRKVGAPLWSLARANGFALVSGLPGIHVAAGKVVDGGTEEQAEASLAPPKRAPEAAGSSPDEVVKATVHVSNAARSTEVNRVHARCFLDRPPARTFVAVGSWPVEFGIEFERMALA